MSPALTRRHIWIKLASVALVLAVLVASAAQGQPAAAAARGGLSLHAVGALAARPLAAGETGVTYTYDAAGRLTRADYAGGASITYTYDSGGNLLRREALQAPSVTFPGGGAAGDVDLSWTHDPLYAGYQVWYSTQPYFMPGDNCAAPPAGMSCTYVAALDHGFTHAGARADVVNNYAYLVLGVAGSGTRSSPSARVGDFTFGLTPGN